MPSVSVFGHDVAIDTRPGEAILTALSRRGYTYRFGCRRGGCGLCKVHLVSGDVHYTKPVAETVLSQDDRHDGVCLTCRAVPLTDVVIRLGDGDSLHCVATFLRDFPKTSPHQPEKKGSSQR